MEKSDLQHEWKNDLEAINKLIFVQNFEPARLALNTLIEDYPTEEILLLRKLELDHKTNYLSLSLAQWKTKSFLVEYILLAELYLKQRTAHEVIELLGSQKAERPSIYHYTLGYCCEMIDDLERAKANYLKTLQHRTDHPPALFGLSQIYYQLGEHETADRYFHEFESLSPYTIYGNFENHRDLAEEFLDQQKYSQAESALTTLMSWWQEHRNQVPIEIEIFIRLFQARIKQRAGESSKAAYYTEQAELKIKEAIKQDLPAEVLYFIAQQCEAFNKPMLAHELYANTLKKDALNVGIAQRICQSKLTQKDYLEAQDLFTIAQQKHPDHEEIQFCKLVTDLSEADVDLEAYLAKKDRLLDAELSEMQKLNLLHELNSMFDSDQDTLVALAEAYMRIGQPERSSKFLQKLESLPTLSSKARITLAHFYVSTDQSDKAQEVLEAILKQSPTESNSKVSWLLSIVLTQKGEYKSAHKHLEKLLRKEPWSVSYLGAMIALQLTVKGLKPDAILDKLLKGQDQNLRWQDFEEQSAQLKAQKEFELHYMREKLRMLYTNDLRPVIYTAVSFNPRMAIHDFIKLLNTNFEQPLVHLALGLFHQELWLHQAAQIWFEQGMEICEGKDLAACYLGMAESKAWTGQDLRAAKEYVIIARDLIKKPPQLCIVVHSHVLLKIGDIKEAKQIIDTIEEPTLYSEYIRGLIEYRNARQLEAKRIWKPLLSAPSKSAKEDYIKQEVMRFYFDKKPMLEFH
jgi:predicted Zn-dependent protease